MTWLRESLDYARKHVALSVACGMIVVTLMAVGLVALRVSILYGDLRQETQDRIQLACDMSFANGQALLDTAARDQEVPPETIEVFRKNLKHYADIEIKKYDPNVQCEIPEAQK